MTIITCGLKWLIYQASNIIGLGKQLKHIWGVITLLVISLNVI
jgi:hypothetical protein